MNPIKFHWTAKGMHPAETLPEAERYVTEKMHDKIVNDLKEKLSITEYNWTSSLKYIRNLEKRITELETKLYHK
jgi:hypothetical protein